MFKTSAWTERAAQEQNARDIVSSCKVPTETNSGLATDILESPHRRLETCPVCGNSSTTAEFYDS